MKKRELVITMLLCMTMTACGNAAGYAGTQGETLEAYPAQGAEAVGAVSEEKTTEDEKPATEDGKPETESGPSEQKTEQAETGETRQEEAAENTAIYDEEGVYMQITLPQEWSYEVLTPDMIQTDGMESGIIHYWLTENPDISFELAYYTMFGICGTGVTQEKMELDSGLDATWYTEGMEETVWFSIFMEKPENSLTEGSYVINGRLEEELWNQYKGELQDIVRTIVVK